MDSNTRIRWDRVALMAVILVGCSSGMVALVGGTEAEEEAFARLTHPRPVVALQRKEAHPVLLRSQRMLEEQKDGEATSEPAVPAAASVAASTGTSAEPRQIGNSQHESTPEEEVVPNRKSDPILPCSCCKKTMRVPRNPYTRHQSAARSLPNSFFVKNDIELRAGQRNGKLVEVKDGRGYRLADLTHSHPWLLPETYQLLKDMGNDFADALEGTPSEGAKFRVTSVTRTNQQQSKLRRRNANATGDVSTHSYGASFDIAFIDRARSNANCGTPTREMERLLTRYQEAGVILVIPEGNCMHITLVKPGAKP
ncbi:MAG: DUF5715 family protein [Bacteroidetes bacterium]|nr:DUF5715 family protein [Bacteroidota bacterium]MDA0904507.1 DUF5715 family protein [Bacteroidota bacterium]MDA1242251.1 DUF5715 family protein [Bacteroidota bacterium]